MADFRKAKRGLGLPGAPGAGSGEKSGSGRA